MGKIAATGRCFLAAWHAVRPLAGRLARPFLVSTVLVVPLSLQACAPRCPTCDPAGGETLLSDPGPPQVTDPRQVRRAQRLLAALGHNPGPVDGLLGPKTANAVAAFQTKRGLDPDGRLSADVLDHLRAVYRSAQVRTAQGWLTALGYDPGPVDGVEGPRTRQAVGQFQNDAGLSTDGRVTAALLSRLQEMTRSVADAPAEDTERVYSNPPFVAGERVLVSVNDGDDMLRELEIAKDGQLTLPWGGQVQAAGLHSVDVEVAIMTELFEDYLAKVKEREPVLSRSEAAQRARRYLMDLEVDVRRANETALSTF